jgi:hypothetical protein
VGDDARSQSEAARQDSAQCKIEFALGLDRCADILAEAGYLQAGSGGVSVLNFSHVPHGLAADELASYLREHGDEICNLKPRS